MMNNRERLDKSAKSKGLYKFFQDNAFLTSGNVQLKSNYPRAKSLLGHSLLLDTA